MKIKMFATLLTLLFSITIYLPNANAEDYTQIGLPEGAKARLGKGIINDTFLDVDTAKFSDDGNLLVLISKDNYTLWDLAANREVPKSLTVSDESKPLPDRFVISGDGAILVTTEIVYSHDVGSLPCWRGGECLNGIHTVDYFLTSPNYLKYYFSFI